MPPEQPPSARPQPANLVIRATTPDDAAGITAIHRLPGYRHGTLRLPHEKTADMLKRIEQTPAGAVTLVALLEDTVVADIALIPMTGRRRHVAELGMGVHDDYVGLGIGRALLGEVLSVADNWLDLKRVQLTVYPDNQAAIALYKRFGFEEEGRHRKFAFRDGAYVDALAMARIRD
ncbi:GNAT family N-acetyltransferase [Agrobacterium sp. ES01]|uniref:GNAT family N-acetyltransferase n=1 Tax=Agrobacterium sp. ES01 TaxID=3420714 RepID=UPI003D0B91B7